MPPLGGNVSASRLPTMEAPMEAASQRLPPPPPTADRSLWRTKSVLSTRLRLVAIQVIQMNDLTKPATTDTLVLRKEKHPTRQRRA